MVLESIQFYMMAYPKTSIIVAAALISFFISLVNFFVLDKEKLHEIKRKQKAIQAEMKNHKGNPQKLMELQKEMFSHVGETFKHSMKPMLITFIPLIILFPWLRSMLLETTIAGTWFWWYLGASIISSIFFRKLFRLP